MSRFWGLPAKAESSKEWTPRIDRVVYNVEILRSIVYVVNADVLFFPSLIRSVITHIVGFTL